MWSWIFNLNSLRCSGVYTAQAEAGFCDETSLLVFVTQNTKSETRIKKWVVNFKILLMCLVFQRSLQHIRTIADVSGVSTFFAAHPNNCWCVWCFNVLCSTSEQLLMCLVFQRSLQHIWTIADVSGVSTFFAAHLNNCWCVWCFNVLCSTSEQLLMCLVFQRSLQHIRTIADVSGVSTFFAAHPNNCWCVWCFNVLCSTSEQLGVARAQNTLRSDERRIATPMLYHVRTISFSNCAIHPVI